MVQPPSARMLPLMAETVAFSLKHVASGGIPFTALIVGETGEILGRGVNRVIECHDPTAHAEVEAIRNACRSGRTPHLQGATLLASGEPCAMCYLSALYAGISHIYYAVDRHAVADHGFDYRGSYRLLETDPRTWASPRARELAVPDRLAPFEAYQRGSRRAAGR